MLSFWFQQLEFIINFASFVSYRLLQALHLLTDMRLSSGLALIAYLQQLVARENMFDKLLNESDGCDFKSSHSVAQGQLCVIASYQL